MVQPKNIIPSIILTGPTAVGKSSLAIATALELKKTANITLEIINADSVCFYQEFNIGSAKPSKEECALVPHHLIDIVHPLDYYHAGIFLKDCNRTLDEIHARGHRALIVGGSGFYLKSLRLGLWDAPQTSSEFRESIQDESNPSLFEKLKNQDPEHAKKIGTQDRYRIIRALEIISLSGKTPTELESSMNKTPDPRFELWVIDREKTELENRMRTRVEQMIANGLVDEVKSLREKFPTSKTLHAIGYQQVLDDLDEKKPEGRIVKPGTTGLIDEITLAHRQLAKQQRTWFKNQFKNMSLNQHFTLDRDLTHLQEKLITFYK